MFMKNGKRKRIKICGSLFLLFITVVAICSGCESYSMYSGDRLAENFENYKSIFEEYDVQAEVVTYEDLEYLRLVFPDGVKATYGRELEHIEYDSEKERYGDIYSVKIEMKIKDKESALVYLDYEGPEGGEWGGTSGTFVLPDFSEMLPSRALKNDDGEALRTIERWTTEKEMADLYKEAKDMEKLMLEYDSEKEEWKQ